MVELSLCIVFYYYTLYASSFIVPKPSQDVHTVTPRTCEPITIHGKVELRLQVELRLLISTP